ncbi:MAG: chromophore lyase CpcT/CpeT [Proteobacteria bacterium]|nr:chromophore lyase CpcT/CpeT [Pseudomonadota bacterium]
MLQSPTIIATVTTALLVGACSSAPSPVPSAPVTDQAEPGAVSGARDTSIAPATQPARDIRADLALLAEWFAGRFDNHLQVWQAKAAQTADDLIHEHIHSIFARVAVPAFGEYVFYVKQYMDGDPKKTYRQRLYTFEPAADGTSIVLRIFAFVDDAAYTDAHLEPGKLADLSPDKVHPTPGCEVYWHRRGDHFVGETKEGACRIQSRRSGKTLIISDNLYLDSDEIWIHDRATDEQGNFIFGHKGNIPHKLRRVREFSGWAAIRKSDIGQGKDGYHLVSDLIIHDQGQRVALATPDGSELGYTIELAQLVYQRTKTPVLKLAIYEKGSDKSLAYAWANPDAERIGVNLGRIQVGLAVKKASR